jgi:hypothetical protein
MFRNRKSKEYKVIEHKAADLRLQVKRTSFVRELSSWDESDTLKVLPPEDLFAHISHRNGRVRVFNPQNKEYLELKHEHVEVCHQYKHFYITCSKKSVRCWDQDFLKAEISLPFSDTQRSLKTVILERNKLCCWIWYGYQHNESRVIDLDLFEFVKCSSVNTYTREVISLSDDTRSFAASWQTGLTYRNVVQIFQPNIKFSDINSRVRLHELEDMTDTTISPSKQFWADYSSQKAGIKVWKVTDHVVRTPVKTFPDAKNPHWHQGLLIYQEQQILFAFDPMTQAIEKLGDMPRDIVLLNGTNSLFKVRRKSNILEIDKMELKLVPMNLEIADGNAEALIEKTLPLPASLCNLIKSYYAYSAEPAFFPRQLQTALPRMISAAHVAREDKQPFRFEIESQYGSEDLNAAVTQQSVLFYSDRTYQLFNRDMQKITEGSSKYSTIVAINGERYVKINRQHLQVFCAKTGETLKLAKWNFQLDFHVCKVASALDGKYLLMSYTLTDVLTDKPGTYYIMVFDTQTFKVVNVDLGLSSAALTMINDQVMASIYSSSIFMMTLDFVNSSYQKNEIFMSAPITGLLVHGTHWIVCTTAEDRHYDQRDEEYISLWHAGETRDDKGNLSYKLSFQQDLGKTNCGVRLQNGSVVFGFQHNKKMLLTEFHLPSMKAQQQWVPSNKPMPITLLPDNQLLLWEVSGDVCTMRTYPLALDAKQEPTLKAQFPLALC